MIMPIKAKAYPFPVLQPDFRTFADSSAFDVAFDLEIELVDGVISQKLTPKVKLENDSIEELLVDGKVGIYVEIFAPSSYQRELLEISLGHKELELSELDLAGNVEFTGVILAKETIDKYFPSDVINEFKEIKTGFLISKSDILAYGHTVAKQIDPDFEVKPDLLRVQPVPEMEDHWSDFLIDAPVLTIQLSSKMMNYWQAYKQDKTKKAVLFTNIYRDCIEAAVDFIQEGSNQEYAWIRTLIAEAQRRNIDIEDGDPRDVAAELLFDKGFGKIIGLEVEGA
ncbi:MAG: hypothetical protein EBT65_05785 [Actinobacteria bacterium]|nr:hypothetical protein [Actinomycetota bacterium]